MGLKRRVDPPRSFTPEQAQQWIKLQEAIEAELGSAGLSNTLFVDLVEGEDGTAERGSLVFKYGTIQGALTAAVAGDMIFVSPGSYVEDIIWPQTEGLTLKGSGSGVTSITNFSAATDTIRMIPTSTLLRAAIQDIAVLNTAAGAGYALTINAATNNLPGSFDNLVLRNLFTETDLGSDIRITTANNVVLRQVECEGDIEMSEVSRCTYIDVDADALQVGYDGAGGVEPTQGRAAHAGTAVILAQQLQATGQAWVALGKDCAVGSIAGTLTENGSDYGIIDFNGRCTANVVVSFEFDQAGNNPHNCVFLDYAQITGAVDIGDSGGAGTQRGLVSARYAELGSTNDQTNRSGNLCDIDLRHATFKQDSLIVAGSGTFDRTHWYQDVAAAGAILPLTMVFADSSGNPIPYPDRTGSGWTSYEYTVLFDASAVTDTDFFVTLPKPVDGDDVQWNTSDAGGNLNGQTRVLIVRPDDDP